jgi:hypothetical protein
MFPIFFRDSAMNGSLRQAMPSPPGSLWSYVATAAPGGGEGLVEDPSKWPFFRENIIWLWINTYTYHF